MEFCLRAIQFIITVLYWGVYAVLAFLLPRKKGQSIPPIQDYLLTLSITELLPLLRTQQITSHELVQAYVDRIREVNPYVNAVVEERFANALKQAAKADELMINCIPNQSNDLYTRYPILGIPFTIKEACGLQGMSHEVGSIQRLGIKAEYTSAAVDNLRVAGGIPLLVSANPEYCFSIETNTYTYGKCVNPYDFRRTSGGSSGGEGALNGCGATLFGVGSDIAGSIRIPSLFNGVFGHKPTGGLTSNSGHFPDSDDIKCLEYLQMGPITRYAKDLRLLLQIIAGKNVHKLDLSTQIDTNKIKIFYALGFDGLNALFHHAVAYDIQVSIVRAVKYFERKGLQAQRTQIKHFKNSIEIALAGIVSISNFPHLIETDDSIRLKACLVELYRTISSSSNYTKEALIFELMMVTNGFMPKHKLTKYLEEAVVLKQEIIDLLGSNGVLFFPTFHVPAIHHHTSVLPLWGIDYCSIFNILGLPCTHIPMGLNSSGLPIGFQVVAAPFQDKLCLQIAVELEQAFGGWTPPTPHNLIF